MHLSRLLFVRTLFQNKRPIWIWRGHPETGHPIQCATPRESLTDITGQWKHETNASARKTRKYRCWYEFTSYIYLDYTWTRVRFACGFSPLLSPTHPFWSLTLTLGPSLSPSARFPVSTAFECIRSIVFFFFKNESTYVRSFLIPKRRICTFWGYLQISFFLSYHLMRIHLRCMRAIYVFYF